MSILLGPHRYDWPVLVPYPSAGMLGQFEMRRLTATFEPIDNEAEEELLTGLARAGRQRDQRRERLRLVLKALKGLLDSAGTEFTWAARDSVDGAPVEDEDLDRLLNNARLVAALDKAYLASVAGVTPGKVVGVKEGYVLDEAATWRFPIDVDLPDPDRAGKTVTHRVTGTFRDLPLSEAAMTNDLIREVIVDVDGFTDAQGKSVPWERARKAAFNSPFISNAMLVAYQRGLDGTAVQARREKN